jgi:uncharacterized protein (DUF1501 family)
MKRREFVEKSLCAAVTSAAFTSLATKMSLAHAATPVRTLAGADYRALVCVYLYGGNDSFNMLAPQSSSHHAIYAATRGALAIPRSGANSLIALNSLNAASDGATYGLHPSMPELAALFNRTSGATPVAMVANVGPLLYPITQAQFLAESVPVPPQLFSHSDQSVYWQTPTADAVARLGWGGRLADLTTAVGQNPTLSMNVSLDGENVFEAGQNVVPYFINYSGVEGMTMDSTSTWPPGQQARRAVFNTLLNANLQHPMERAFAAQSKRTINAYGQFRAALDLPLNTAMESRFNYAFNGNEVTDYLGAQLRMVARLINRRETLGMVRQIFFVGIGGFDTHTNQLADHVNILRSLSRGLSAFYLATEDMGLQNSITTFTASEFGRTLTPNSDGTDHGWGGHQIVVGGAVQGRRYYGNFPSLLATGNPQSTGWGTQIIPTTSVDQYAWTLARWYGLQNGDRDLVFPNVSRFGGSQQHLNFLG